MLPAQSNRFIDFTGYIERYCQYDPLPECKDTLAFTWDAIRCSWSSHFRERWEMSEFRNDWVRPKGLFEPCGLVVRIGQQGLPAFPVPRWSGLSGLWFYRDRESRNRDEARDRAIVELLLPTFDSGAHLVARWSRRLVDMPMMLDIMEDAIALYDETGKCVHENRVRQLLVRDDPEAPRIARECAQAAISIASIIRKRPPKSRVPSPDINAVREVRTGVARYRIRGALLGSDIVGPRPLVVVIVTRELHALPPTKSLREQFSLTAREATVANLLANGKSNSEIAGELGITIHTARRHVEHILSKLDARTRGAAAAKLRKINP